MFCHFFVRMDLVLLNWNQGEAVWSPLVPVDNLAVSLQ